MSRVFQSVKKVPSVSPSLTLLDGTHYVKEFPAWVSRSDTRSTISINHSSKQSCNAYYECLKPIFILLTFAGVLPVFRIRTGSHKVQVTLISIICLVVYASFGFLTFNATKFVAFITVNDDDFNSFALRTILIMLFMQHWFYLFITWPESIAVNRYFNQWKVFLEHYESVTGMKLALTCRRKITVILFAAVLLALITPYVPRTVFAFNNTTYIVVSYQALIQISFFLLWISNSWAICQVADHFNNHLAQACSSDISPVRLEELRLIWLQLTELVRTGSSMVSYTMALMIIIPFAFMTLTSYSFTMFVIRAIQQGGADDQSVKEAVCAIVLFTFDCSAISLFCNSGHWMTVKCMKTKDILLGHKPRLTESFARVNGEIRLFLRCLRAIPPHATMSGYVVIDRKAFLHMAGVLVTYLIILVQFNIGSTKPKLGDRISSTTISPS